MAIFAGGSNFYGDTEMKNDFFNDENFVIGWDYDSARDLYNAVSSLKAGDIIYLKTVAPAALRSIKVKGIGIITKSFIQCLIDDGLKISDITKGEGLYVKMKWVVKSEFKINIPDTEGKLNSIRASTFYEEYLPFVQHKIIEKLFEAK